MEIVRRAGAARPARDVITAAPAGDTVTAPLPLTVSQRLQQLETLHVTGAITEAEYSAKRREILADL